MIIETDNYFLELTEKKPRGFDDKLTNVWWKQLQVVKWQ